MATMQELQMAYQQALNMGDMTAANAIRGAMVAAPSGMVRGGYGDQMTDITQQPAFMNFEQPLQYGAPQQPVQMPEYMNFQQPIEYLQPQPAQPQMPPQQYQTMPVALQSNQIGGGGASQPVQPLTRGGGAPTSLVDLFNMYGLSGIGGQNMPMQQRNPYGFGNPFMRGSIF
jgi:hypothetical protein